MFKCKAVPLLLINWNRHKIAAKNQCPVYLDDPSFYISSEHHTLFIINAAETLVNNYRMIPIFTYTSSNCTQRTLCLMFIFTIWSKLNPDFRRLHHPYELQFSNNYCRGQLYHSTKVRLEDLTTTHGPCRKSRRNSL